MTRILSGRLGSVAAAVGFVSLLPGMPASAADAPAVKVRTEVYRTVGDVELSMTIYDADPTAEKPRAAIVFFFGGGWRNGSTKQFEQHSAYLAQRGLVAMTADYRVRNRHGVTADECVKDAKAAVRWIRTHAQRLKIDPQRIVAAGGSAGGHLAAATALLPGFDPASDQQSVSPRPNALILFNPAVDLTPAGFNVAADSERMRELRERLGATPEELSPLHHIGKQAAPTLIVHGEDDSTVPIDQVKRFEQRMRAAGHRCELAAYPGASHGFFNFGRGGNRSFTATLTRADRFLVSLGYLQGEPHVADFVEQIRAQ